MPTLTVNGQSFQYPDPGSQSWGTAASAWASAVSAGTLQKSGGLFQLTADANFGTTYGLLSNYFTSNSANSSQTGVVRLSNSDSIGFRNAGNSADILLTPHADGILQYGGVDLVTLSATQTLTGKSISGATNTFTQLPVGALSGQVSFANGGTGQSTQQTAINALLGGTVTTGFYARGNGTNIVMAQIPNTDLSGITNAQLSGSAGITNANLATMAANTVKANVTGGSATPTDVAVTTQATGSTVMYRDSSANVAINNINEAFQTTVTAGGTTTLTVASAPLQQFTGTSAQNLVLPAATTLATGCQFYVFNRSTGVVTVKDGSGSVLLALSAGAQGCFTCAANGSTAGTWDLSSTYTGTLPIALGGTGQATQQLALNALAPPSPTSGQVISYNGSNWVASTPAAGTKNYLTAIQTSNGINPGNGNFEFGTTSGWSKFNTTVANSFPTGSITAGATSLTTFANITSGQLEGSNSLQVGTTSGTAWGSGEGFITDAFFVDKEDQAKVLTIKLYYSATAGAANLNWAGTIANNLAVAVWDVTNSAWIQPAGSFGFVQSSGVGYLTGTFQTTSNSTQYRLAVLNVNGTAAGSTGATTVVFDSFYIGPQTAPVGPAVSDFGARSWTPTGSWTTNTTYTGQWKRVGDEMIMEVALSFAGAPSSGNLIVNLPSGYAIDTTKFLGNPVSATAAYHSGGSAYIPSAVYNLVATYNDTQSFFVSYTTGTANGNVTPTAPATFGATSKLVITVRVPIVGWSSNTAMSADTDTRVTAAALQKSTSQGSISASTWTKVTFDVVPVDTHGVWDGTNNRYVTPVSGIYSFRGVLYENGSSTAYGGNIGLYKNGSPIFSIAATKPATTGWGFSYDFSLVSAKAGDYFELWFWSPATGCSIAGNLTSSACTTFNIERSSGPAVVAASESVGCRYNNPTPPATYASGSVLQFPTKDYDSHGAFSTSTNAYAVPVSGKYRISAMIQSSSSWNPGTGQFYYMIDVYKNTSTLAARLDIKQSQSNVAQVLCLSGSTTLSFVAGETIQVQMTTSSGTFSTVSGNYVNWICIERIGN